MGKLNLRTSRGSSRNDHVHDDHQSMKTYEAKVEDASGHNHGYECQTTNMDPNANEPPDPNANEPPNPEVQRFYDMLDVAQRPVWLGSHMSKL